MRAIPVGSQLELTGTCVIQGVSQDVAFFGLLLKFALRISSCWPSRLGGHWKCWSSY